MSGIAAGGGVPALAMAGVPWSTRVLHAAPQLGWVSLAGEGEERAYRVLNALLG